MKIYFENTVIRLFILQTGNLDKKDYTVAILALSKALDAIAENLTDEDALEKFGEIIDAINRMSFSYANGNRGKALLAFFSDLEKLSGILINAMEISFTDAVIEVFNLWTVALDKTDSENACLALSKALDAIAENLTDEDALEKFGEIIDAINRMSFSYANENHGKVLFDFFSDLEKLSGVPITDLAKTTDDDQSR